MYHERNPPVSTVRGVGFRSASFRESMEQGLMLVGLRPGPGQEQTGPNRNPNPIIGLPQSAMWYSVG